MELVIYNPLPSRTQILIRFFIIKLSTLISLTKNLVYKNIEAQMQKKMITIIRTSPASKKGIYEYSYFICIKTAVIKKNCVSDTDLS